MNRLGRLRWALFAAVAVAVVAAAVASGRLDLPGGDDGPGVLGPGPDEDVDGYVVRKRVHLERLAAHEPDRAAAGVVSLARYVSVESVFELGSGGRVDVLYLRGRDGIPASLVVAGSREHAQDVLGAGCGCVYGFVLHRSTIGRLVVIQRDRAVRLVDVADPPTTDLRGWELSPLVPKEARS